VDKVKRAADGEARGEIQHLAASVAGLTRASKVADAALATIRAQSEAATLRANAEIADLKRQVQRTNEAAFNEACAALRVDHQQCAADFSKLSDQHDRSVQTAAAEVSTLRKAALDAEAELAKVGGSSRGRVCNPRNLRLEHVRILLPPWPAGEVWRGARGRLVGARARVGGPQESRDDGTRSAGGGAAAS
jgi:hypothetical protein